MLAAPARLPYGVGRLSRRGAVVLGFLLALLAVGVISYSREVREGLIVTGLRDIGTMGGATWGLYVAFVVYFVGVSFAGITIAVLVRLLDLPFLRPLTRMAELLTVVSLILAALAVLIDLGQPLRGFVNLLRYGRPMSPFFGTFTLVISGYLLASLVYLYLDGRRDAALCARVPGRLQRFHRLWAAGYGDTPAEQERHRRASFWLALAILPLLVTAHSTLGFVFGLQVGRPGWFSALQAPGFVVLAGVSGLGLLVLIAALVQRSVGGELAIEARAYRWLANALMVLLVAYLYFMVVELLTATYAGHHHEVRLTTALLGGPYAGLYWSSVALLLLPAAGLFWQYVTGRYSKGLIVSSGLLVNVAAILKRYLIVVPSQTHGALLPYATGSYRPSPEELTSMLGLWALGGLMYLVFMKVFPISEVPAPERR